MGNLIERQENGHLDTYTQFPQAPVPHLLPGGLGEWKSTMVNIVRMGFHFIYAGYYDVWHRESPFIKGDSVGITRNNNHEKID